MVVERRARAVYPRGVIALLDYGSGNLRSVEKALRKVGADVQVITRPDGMKSARAAVLPGVGAFDDCITAMQRQELLGGVREFIAAGRLFYTTDGSDPRARGGSVASMAMEYATPINLPSNSLMTARVRSEFGLWSAPVKVGGVRNSKE